MAQAIKQIELPYQTVGFHFAVIFQGLGTEDLDARFQSVSGLDVRWETEEIKEGGENRFTHNVPTRRKYADLTLKRGLLSPSAGSAITAWCLKAFEELKVIPVNLQVCLLDEDHRILMQWNVQHARPKSWKVAELNAERGEVLIETIELSYNSFTFSAVNPKVEGKIDIKTPNLM
jgi:phage tail-like protein